MSRAPHHDSRPPVERSLDEEASEAFMGEAPGEGEDSSGGLLEVNKQDSPKLDDDQWLEEEPGLNRAPYEQNPES